MARDYRYKDIQLPQLRSFCVAAVQGNFSTAAQTLGLSVSTVWEQVRALEQKLGAVLFRQRGRSVALTLEGRLLLELVQPHIDGLDSLERLFETRRGQLVQRLTIASSHYLIHYHLPPAIREFAAVHPAVQLNVEAPGVEIMPLVERGEADLAIAPYDRELPRNASLEYDDLFELPLVLLTPSRHPLARKKQITLDDVAAYPLIMPAEESYTRRVMKRILHRRNFTGMLRVAMETTSFDTIQKYVAQGVGVALVHATDNPKLLAEGVHTRVFDSSVERLPIALVVRKYAHLAEPVQAFRKIIHRCLSQS
jgi:DNA-binding transcriptional LysR family regulator